MIAIPKPEARKKTETDLVHEIRAELTKLEWCTLFRNNNTTLKDVRGIPISAGLGKGSADLVGEVKVVLYRELDSDIQCVRCGTCWFFTPEFFRQTVKCGCPPLTRFFALEVKRPDKPSPLTEAQVRWGESRRAMGSYWYVVNRLEDAVWCASEARKVRFK